MGRYLKRLLSLVGDFRDDERFIDLIFKDQKLMEVIRPPTSFSQMMSSLDDESRVLAQEYLRLKRESIENSDKLIKKACENVEENKGHCYTAKDKEEARKIVEEVVGEGIIIRSLDLTVEEVNVDLALRGRDVIESFLPTLIEKLGEKGYDTKGVIEELGGNPLSFMREKLYEAHAGITGVTAFAADPGSMFIVSDTGLDRLVSMTPLIHVAIVGYDEVVPTYSDAFKVSEFVIKATNPHYLGIIGGPSKTGDIEKRITYGAHGPKEVHVIFLDDGRTDVEADKLACLRVGKLPFVSTYPTWKKMIGEGEEWGEECTVTASP